jgi:hypothetical protein
VPGGRHIAIPRRVVHVATGAALAAAMAGAGCGGNDGEAPPWPVRLLVAAPQDTAVVRDDEISVRGTVRPSGAQVRVAGRDARVRRSGRWSATVPLRPGGNVVDVSAALEGRAPAVRVVRVVRQMPILVPDLEGRSPAEAREELVALGLSAEFDEGGGLLDDLLPGEEGVCGTEPDAGEEVRPGDTVTVRVAKVC